MSELPKNIRKNGGVDVTGRRRVNLVEGTHITLTVADDPTNSETDVTINASDDTIVVRKNGGADVGARARINFIEGANTTLTVSDDVVNNEVDITIASTVVAGAARQAWTYIFVQTGGRYLAINGATGVTDYDTASAYTTIQSAITATSGVYGSKDPTSYLLGPGTWSVTASIVLPEECTFAGCGPESTRLVASGSIGPVITSRNATYTWGVQIRDMRIDGNNTATYGIYWYHTTCTLPSGHTYYSWLSLSNILVRQCATNPIYQRRTTGIHTISFWDNIRVTGAIYLEGVSDSKFTDVFCYSLTVKSMASTHFATWYIGGAVSPNLRIYGGTAAYPCEKNVFTDVRSDNPSGCALSIEDYAHKNSFVGCQFTNHNSGGADNTFAAVHLEDYATYNTFTGCLFCRDATLNGITNNFKYWYEEAGSADYNVLTGCIFHPTGIGTAAIGAHGANTTHTNNIGA